MKKGFIVFLEVALVLLFLQSSYGQSLLREGYDFVMGVVVGTAEHETTQARLAFQTTLLNTFDELNTKQMEYVHSITDSQEELARFNALYCVKQDINPFVYGHLKQYMCTEIVRLNLLMH